MAYLKRTHQFDIKLSKMEEEAIAINKKNRITYEQMPKQKKWKI